MFSHIKELFTRPSGYTIARSVRLRSSASGYFSRTPSASSRTTWTWTAWVKRGKLGSAQALFSAGTGTAEFRLTFTSSDTIEIYEYTSPSYNWQKITTAVYRDPSAWYQIQLVYDTTNGTAGDRVKLYVNSVQVTSFGTNTNPTPSFSGYVNSAVAHGIGSFSTGSSYLDGYLTEINFIDGQALTPSSFGETDSITGVWKAKKYSGTYGTNGFYLNFSDNSSNTATTIGKDYSGNGNNWTPNNISVTSGVTYDSMVDSPTVSAVSSNYATLNPLAVGSSGTLSDGSLKIAGVNSTNVGASYSTIGMTTGKWYFEVTAVGVGSNFTYALVEDVVDTSALNVSGSIFAGYRSTGDTYGTVVIATTTWNSAGVVIGVAVDCDNGAIYFANANTWINSGVPTSGASRTGAITTYTAGTKTLHGGVGCYQNSSQSAAINFGQRPFTYTPPTGFVALNTYNLPASTIKNGGLYMKPVLYTGDGTTNKTITGTGFQPDWLWLKMRSSADDNVLVDSVRGGSKRLKSNTTDAESDISYPTLASDGFVVSGGAYNNSGATFVAWQWKAGGTSSSNTNGSITSTVSVNTTAGFSIVLWTGNGSASATVGHGLNAVPAMIICKERTGTDYWHVKHQSTPSNTNLYLNTTNANTSAASVGDGVLADLSSSTTFGFATAGSPGNVVSVNENGILNVAYCFAAVAGYSAFGSYTGNGSADGPFVFLGFRPRFVLVKDSTAAGGYWEIHDTSRSTYNATTARLWPNVSSAEATGADIDFLSNGFKVRTTDGTVNNSGSTVIYAAFAESPFKNSLARQETIMFKHNNTPIPLDTPFTIDGTSYPANWLRLTSLAEKQAVGIEEVADVTTTYDDRFFWGVDNPKLLNDREESDEDGKPMYVKVLGTVDGKPAMVDSTERLVTKGLKSQWIATVKDTANKLLAQTDWMVIRKAERDVAIPTATATYRQAVLTECSRLVTAIAGASDIEAFIAVVTSQGWPDAS